ncbi:hypothetical protein PS673_04850 [Pseudomonas fluorescens]|uniref:Uncharacterized protein n=1 Tax=Pseudomonas fluorescens TaxID=294 RepID=A0A5E7PPV7_PSEFL|nr:hypothetical protein PS673_04850 [Pseudomonas fluorescens]VVP51785.1 hypothetical protein PS843_05359 [Pseudomonas fluorescens]
MRYSTVVVGVRSKGVVAIGTDGQRTDTDDGRCLACGETAGHASDGEAGDAERRLGIAIVGQYITRCDAVFGQSASISGHYARGVDGRDGCGGLVAGIERSGGSSEIRTIGCEADGRIDAGSGGVEHHGAVTTTGGTARTCDSRAGSGGFKVFCRVGTGSNGLLQLFYRRRGLRGGGCQISAGVWSVGAPLSVTAQIEGAAIGQLQGYGTGKAGVDLVTGEQLVAFNENSADALWGHHENLTDNAFDDGNNTAH